MEKPNRLLLPAILIFSFLFKIWLYVGLGFNDDIVYARFARDYTLNGYLKPTWWYATRLAAFLPITPFYRFFGVSEASTSAYFLLCSVGTIAAIYFVAKQLFNQRAAVVAAVILSVFPVDVVWSTQIGPDVPQQLFSTLAVLALIGSFQSKGAAARIGLGLCAGLSVGLVHSVRETAPVTLFILAVLTLFIAGSKGECPVFAEARLSASWLGVGLGLLVSIGAFETYFYLHEGQWFIPERMRLVTVLNDRNNNYSLLYYVRGLYNLDQGRYQWQDNISYFGWIYYFVSLALLRGLFRKDIRIYFVISWLVILFLSFEFGPNLCDMLSRAVAHRAFLQPRECRYLIQLSVPASILLAVGLDEFWGKGPFAKGLASAVFLFVVVTSIGYSYSGATFIRKGMLNVKEAAACLQTLPRKVTYTSAEWDIQKMRYFMGFRDDVPFRRYECGAVNCLDEQESAGASIHDAYVVLNIDPYAKAIPSLLPTFAQNVPQNVPPNWQLIKSFHIPNKGIFEFEPRIYYAPAGR